MCEIVVKFCDNQWLMGVIIVHIHSKHWSASCIYLFNKHSMHVHVLCNSVPIKACTFAVRLTSLLEALAFSLWRYRRMYM